MPRYRYFANRTLNRGVDEKTGELLLFQRGEEIPESQFGSGQALMAAIHKGYVAQVPVAEADKPAEKPKAAAAKDGA